MILNIQDIINKKLEQMAADKVIENKISETIENTITKAVEDVFTSYDFKESLRKKLKSEVSEVVEAIGFTAYNQFISDTMQRMMEGAMREDVKQKIKGAFDSIFVKKIDVINMSDIVEAYKTTVLNDSSIDIYDLRNHFHVSITDNNDDDSVFRYKTIKFALDKDDLNRIYAYSQYYLEMKLMAYKNDDFTISSVIFEGHDLSRLEELRFIRNFEAFIASLYFNNTKIVMDVDEYSIDTSLEED